MIDVLITFLLLVFIAITATGAAIFVLKDSFSYDTPRGLSVFVRVIGSSLFTFILCLLIYFLYSFWTNNQHKTIDELTQLYFLQFDKNQDKIIDIRQESKARISKYSVDKMTFFLLVDKNKDGQIDKEEMKFFLQKFDFNQSGIIENL